VTISESTSRDLEGRFPAARGKTTAIPLAAGDAFRPDPGLNDAEIRARHGLDGPYVLAVGTLEPRKNLPRLIEAFAGLTDAERGGRRLTLVGASGWETDETFEAIRSEGSLVTTLGWVTDEELPAIYRGADLFAYPSLYEGFGLPVLEAMSCGVPVLTSEISSLPEVGGDAVRYADPRDTGSIRGALRELLADPAARATLSYRGASGPSAS